MENREVVFTGLTVPVESLLKETQYGGRLVMTGPYPSSWTRFQVKVSSVDNSYAILAPIDRFIADHLNGKWGRYFNPMTQHVVLFFEDVSEAVMFRFHGDKPFEHCRP